MSLGVRSIDAEHKHLIDFIGIIERAPIDKQGRILSPKMFSTLRALLQQHFLHEEDLMYVIKYPKVSPHTIAHSSMLTTFDMLAVDFDQAGDPTPFIEFITGWIVGHLKEYDMDLADFVNKLKQAKAQKISPKKEKMPTVAFTR
ncbi:MAG: hemerythrin family protein [Rhodospirillaceae bacterium]